MSRGPHDCILMLAGSEDDAAFRAYAESIGLTLLHPHAYKMTFEENKRAFEIPEQGGCFSFLPVERLHRHPHPDIGLCHALDPLIPYIRPFYKPPHLIAGQVIWYRDVEAFARQTRPYFQKLWRWVQTNWQLREDGYLIGPHGGRILHGGAKVAYMPPNVTTKTIIIE